MTDSRHTKGPWRVTRHNGLPHAIVAPDEDLGSIPVATIQIANDHEANASLLAAAPDMLAALKWYAEQLSHVRKNHREGDEARSALSDDCGKRAELSIAKASA